MDVIFRSQEEIDDVLNAVMKQVDKGGSKFRGMTYEQGLEHMYRWLTEETVDEPVYVDDEGDEG